MKILIVDDNRQTVEEVASVFKKMGYKVVKAYSSREGIEKAKREQPNIILLDSTLPEVDGYHTFRIIRDAPETSHIPIILAIGTDVITDEQMGEIYELTEGIDGYVRKPLSGERLKAKIEEVLRKK